MAVRIILVPPTLPNAGESVIETLVEVATDAAFTNVVATVSTTLANELYNVALGTQLVPGTTYHTRAAFVTNVAGVEGWGPTVTFVAQNVVEQSISLRPPDVARAPTLSIPLYGTSGTPLTNFRVDVAIDASIDAEAIGADLLIEDVNGNVIVATAGIDRDFRSIVIQRWLRPDELYKIGVSITLSSGSKSMFGSILVHTGSVEGEFKILSHTVNATTSDILMQIPLGSDKVELELFDSVSMIYSDYNVIGNTASYSANLEAVLEVGRVRNLYLDGRVSNWYYFYKVPKPVIMPLDLPAPLG